MRLTQLLRIAYPKKKRIPGLKYGGANQKIKPIRTSMKIQAVNKLMREEQNLIYLNNPYLSKAEEQMYGQEHSLAKREAKRIAFFLSLRKPFYSDKTIEDHYEDTVYTQKKWE